MVAFESSYKKRTYQDRLFKLKLGSSATKHFFDPTGVMQFLFKWSSFFIPSPRVIPSDFSTKEKGHVDVLEKLSSDINTLNLQGIGCTELICHAEDPAILQQHFSESFIYWLCFCLLT